MTCIINRALIGLESMYGNSSHLVRFLMRNNYYNAQSQENASDSRNKMAYL